MDTKPQKGEHYTNRESLSVIRVDEVTGERVYGTVVLVNGWRQPKKARAAAPLLSDFLVGWRKSTLYETHLAER